MKKDSKSRQIEPGTWEHECAQCNVTFIATGSGSHLRRYCDEHYVGNTAGVSNSRLKAAAARAAGERLCLICDRRIGPTQSKSRKYCSVECQQKNAALKSAERHAARALVAKPEGLKANTAYRKGPDYDLLMSRPDILASLDRSDITKAIASRMLGISTASLSRSYATYRLERAESQMAENWTMDAEIVKMVPRELLEELRAIVKNGEADSAGFRLGLDELVNAYIAFQERFFEIAPGVTFIVKGFHRIWIRSIIRAWLTGDKQMILSPPRHGKSEMLIRFVVWAICLDPTVRVMWIAANQDVAGLMLGAVRDHLENNIPLVEAVLAPGETFRPARTSGKPWHTTEIKINQMNIIGQKSSTMLALGRTSAILSRDVDILITDDFEDFDSTREPGGRLYGRNKFAEQGTRKEERTCWIYISSRQHPEDLASHLLESGSAQGWKIIVNTAHEDCQLDPEQIEGHDENGCVLFPEVRSYRWLLEKKHEMEDLGLSGAYEMRYLNAPRPTSGLVFRVETIRELCLDRSRDLGTAGLPAGRLIGGLDPAARGTQAGFGWLWTPKMLYMVDLETQEAGGFEGALRLFADWDNAYDMKDWRFEDNSFQVEFFRDPRLKAMALERGINVKGHTTGKNKQDKELGLSSMAPFYHEGLINLPYGTAEARRKVNLLIRQLQNWTTEGRAVKGKSDIKMASWFPFPTILKWKKETNKLVLNDQGTGSYPGVNRLNDVGWSTPYPGKTERY